jgi:hypothetical protein
MAVTLAVVAVFAWLTDRETDRLGQPAILTGASTLAGLILLFGLGLRRRLPCLPLGTVSTWTQVHLYVGIFTTAMYALHVPALIAGGVFESVLSLLFVIVAASGFYGIYASRTLPKKLSAVESEPRFDRIGWMRTELASASARVCDQLREPSAKEVLQRFYGETLAPFFTAQPSLAYLMVPSGGRRRRLLSELRDLDRYLERDGRRAAGQLAALVRRRDDLDYQFALQLRLRLWVVVHGILSVVLLVASLMHVLLVIRFLD